jgi:hypothetical protein
LIYESAPTDGQRNQLRRKTLKPSSTAAPFGVDVRLSDLSPERYPEADGYVTSQPLDAAEPEELRHAFELAGPDCAAIITNTPHNTVEACATVRNLIALVEVNTSNLA